MDVVQIITQVGFPIFCVLALGWFIRNVYDMMVEKSGEREERLYQVIVETQAQNQQLASINAEFAEVLKAYKADLETIREDVSEIKDYFRTEKRKE
jgi:hypothetical protein